MTPNPAVERTCRGQPRLSAHFYVRPLTQTESQRMQLDAEVLDAVSTALKYAGLTSVSSFIALQVAWISGKSLRR